MAFQEKGGPKETKVSEAPLELLGLQAEPSGSGGQREPLDLLESQASQGYQGCRGELESWGRQGDQGRR